MEGANGLHNGQLPPTVLSDSGEARSSTSTVRLIAALTT